MSSLYAPAELVEPYVPPGDAPDPWSVSALTLEQLLIYADANAPAVQTAEARAGLTDADLLEAQIMFPSNPELGLALGGHSVSGDTGFTFEVELQQQIEIGGQTELRLDAAGDRRLVGEAAVNEVRWAVHVEVHRLFVLILLERERLAHAERFVALAESMRDIAGRQVEAGESSPLILLVADADIAQTQEQVIDAQQGLDALRSRLASVSGWPDAVLPSMDGQLPDVRPVPDIDVLLGLMAEHHPSIRTRELAVSAGRSRVALEEREAWPDPTFGLSYEYDPSIGPEDAGHTWLFHVQFPVPVWRSNEHGQARAQAELEVSDCERDANLSALRAEITEAHIAVNAAIDRVALYATGVVPQLEDNLSLLQLAYELGEVDVHEVSQTRERLLNAMSQYIDALVSYHESTIALESLVGTELWHTDEVSP